MTSTARLASGWIFFGTVVLLVAWCSVSPAPAEAQSAGNNTVYNASGTCCSGPSNASPAFIDASVFASQNTDICLTLYSIMSTTNPPFPGWRGH